MRILRVVGARPSFVKAVPVMQAPGCRERIGQAPPVGDGRAAERIERIITTAERRPGW